MIKFQPTYIGFLIAFIFSFTACKKDSKDIELPQLPASNNSVELVFEEVTSPIVFEFTSTGCPGCGQWGKGAFESIIESNPEITPLAIHIKYGDVMITEHSTSIGANRHGILYTPQIWVNDSNAVIIQGSGISGQQSIQRASSLIAEASLLTTPALSAKLKRSEGKIEVDFGTKFINFQDDGEFYLSCFLTEDGIQQQQAGYTGNPATHNHVIRLAAGNTYGQAFSKADLKNNSLQWNHTFTLSEAFNPANCYVTLVLWRKIGNRYSALNGLIAR